MDAAPPFWFVVVEFGGEDPVQGSVYQNGIPETVSVCASCCDSCFPVFCALLVKSLNIRTLHCAPVVEGKLQVYILPVLLVAMSVKMTLC